MTFEGRMAAVRDYPACLPATLLVKQSTEVSNEPDGQLDEPS